jgi:hypothetical protein
VTAAAIVMVAAFCGFVAGSVVGLQQFESVAKVARIKPSPLQEPRSAFRPAAH